MILLQIEPKNQGQTLFYVKRVAGIIKKAYICLFKQSNLKYEPSLLLIEFKAADAIYRVPTSETIPDSSNLVPVSSKTNYRGIFY